MLDREEVLIERVANGGTVAHAADGRAVFVRHAIPGERVRIEFTEERAKFLRGDAVDVVSASEHRVKAPCPYAHADGCGGCDLQHVAAEYQPQWKATLIAEQLRRVAHLEYEVTVQSVGDSLLGTRTRLRCAVDDMGHLAMRKSRSNELQSIAGCVVANPVFTEGFISTWDGAEEVEMRLIGDGPGFAVVTFEDGTQVTSDFDGLIDEEPRRSSVLVGKNRFRVSGNSFWQSHELAPEILTKAVMKMAKPRPRETVVDLYAGVGLFTVPLAIAVGPEGHVTAIETSDAACADARRNVADLPQVSVVEKTVNRRQIMELVPADSIVVLDPPRNGAGIEVMKALAKALPRRIVYVSCDAATFARDIAVLRDSGYELGDLEAFDLFPMTEHVELVGVLDRRS